ncbi:hypothetical protein LDENG_00204620, partial [Lucifuga dentata]
MHLKPCPVLLRSELRVDPSGIQTSSQQRRVYVSQQGAQQRTGIHGNISGGRLPFSVISTNTLRGSDVSSSVNVSLKVQLLPSPLCRTVTEDGDASLDIWTVIKPGHVREKIAIFASDGGAAAVCGKHADSVGFSGRDRTPQVVCANHAPTFTLSRAAKAKGGWEENGSAKRRRRSGGNHNHNLQQDPRVHKPDRRLSDTTLGSGGGRAGGEVPAVEKEEPKVSVVEMVAFLEQRASEQQPDVKPLLSLQRSSTTITLSRAPPTQLRHGSEEEEEPESIRVSDMVAKLESEYLRRRTEGGDLSRNNSLQRTAGRVLLAQASSASSPPPSSSSSSQSGAPTPNSWRAQTLPGSLRRRSLFQPPTHPSRDIRSRAEKPSRRQEQAGGSAVLARRLSASQDFLEKRQRLQQLLEPQSYLLLLPHHLLLKLFLLLPTRSLASLKCTCHYFKFIVENYGVRPADSLWVSDPRYRDDPCKQCKKRYGHGD